MPKGHRGGSTGLLRSHSRASSTSRLGANLQLTQKDQHQSKSVDKPKKTSNPHDTYSKGLARGPSAQHVHSRERVQQVVQKQRTSNQSNAKPQAKPGFTIATPGEEDDDEGEWESSESGAATPNNHHSDSESELDEEEAIRRLTGDRQLLAQLSTKGARVDPVSLSRIETARQSDFRVATNRPPLRPESSPQTTQPPQQKRHDGRAEVRTPTLPPIQTTPVAQMQQLMTQNHRPNVAEAKTASPPPETPSPDKPSPRIPNRRHAGTRPSSSHSIRSEQSLRPHPLIRGVSYGQPTTPKPVPLEPLTVIQDIPTSAPPSQTFFPGNKLSSSPTSSLKPSVVSPRVSEQGLSSQRRQSVSSARSVSTLPVHPGFRDSVNWSLSDRTRTSSTISQTSSSAALSSLVHLPTVTRPPSPQAIAFFPPVNPHANLEGIHPLLPGPYLNNHLTILARRTPIKEAFDRVIRAKQARC
ncbi:hypothetical protein C0992_004840 [Termitomyces sp. T32_za158]|nr:hypothetical protein C0992_004840 [Termitomyces sp. T32_za158]